MPPRPTPSISRQVKGLPRYYMDCGWYRHPRFAGLGPDALFLFEAAVGYCTEHATDGVMPGHHEDLAAALGLRASHVKKAIGPLLERGALTAASDGTIAIRNWAEHNPTSAEVEEFNRSKAKSGALGNHKRWHESRGVVDPECEFCDSHEGSHQGSQVRSERAESEQDSGENPVRTSENASNSDPVDGGNRIGHSGADLEGSSTVASGSVSQVRSVRDRKCDRETSHEGSHGMGWDGNTSSSPPPSPIANRPDQVNPEEDQPPNPERTATLAIEHMARCDLRQAQAGGTPIRQPDRWLAKATETRRAAHHEQLLAAATDRPTAGPVTLAEEIDPACGPDDGGLARAKAEAALSVQAAAVAEARRAENTAWREQADAILEQLDGDQRTWLDGLATETNPTLRRMELRRLATEHFAPQETAAP